MSDETFISESVVEEEIEWHATAARWKRTACRIANRGLTDAAHARYLGTQEPFRDPCASPAEPRGSAFCQWLRRVLDPTIE